MKENNVADLLIKLRKKNEFTQTDLADRLDVSFQAVSKWERGENLPDAFTLLDLARIYSITVDEILKGELLIKDEIDIKDGLSVNQAYAILPIGIILIVSSPVWYFVFKNFGSLNIIVLITAVALGIGLVVYSGIVIDSAQKEDTNYQKNKKLEDIVYGISFVVFFLAGSIFGIWYISWVSFIIGWIVIKSLEKNS